MAVAFEELIDSPHVRIDEGRFQATRRFKIAWGDTIAFCFELCGGWSNVGGGFTFSLPAPFPGVPQAYCRSVEFAPFPPDQIAAPASIDLAGSTNQPLFALATATYQIDPNTNGRQQRLSLQSLVPRGTYVSLQADIGVQRVTLPGASIKVEGRPAEPQTLVGLDLPTEQFTVVWERVPYLLVPWQQIMAARGALNRGDFHSYPPECVMFQGAQLEYDFQFSGDVLCKLRYRFVGKTARGAGNQLVSAWTHTFSAEAGHFVPVKTATDRPLYAQADFNSLFTFEPAS